MSNLRSLVKRFIPPGITAKLRKVKDLSKLAYEDLRVNILGDTFPLKPRSISFMANDICNSRCEMCLIWEKKKDHEITADELRQILNEPLFVNIQDIGITGGEPTLRKDLTDLVRVIAEKRPKVHGISMITNAIRETEVRQRVLEAAEICRTHNIGFSVMVSLDGVGEVHDAVRGRPGNFETVMTSIDSFRSAGIKVTFGATITTSNAHHIDELLDYAEEKGLYGRFRVAEFIDRLYNESQSEFIRNFDPLTKYHLGLFYSRLYFDYEKSSMIQKTYASIRGMLCEGKPRTTGCPYHQLAVILTSRGELLYCSPKSPNLGSILKVGSAAATYFSNLGKRTDLRRNHCDDCIHDYHVPETFREKIAFFRKNRRIGRTYNNARLLRRSRAFAKVKSPSIVPGKLSSQRVLIVGWYGTETVGDKAILWGIVDRLRRRKNPPREIFVSSFYPFVTEWTKRELKLPDLKVVETFTSEFERTCDLVDEVVIGGGPLMDVDGLNHMLYAFMQMARRGKIARVEGCGIGPLARTVCVNVVKEIMRLADHITLRDQASTQRCQREFKEPASCEEDPALEYLRHLRMDDSQRLESSTVADERSVNFFLREWPRVYSGELDDESFSKLSNDFQQQIEELILYLSSQHGLKSNLLPMHTFIQGGDDRIFNRRLERSLKKKGISDEDLFVQRLPIAPQEICQAMVHGRLNVCMRYHSVFFAEKLGTEYLAIDYTGGGKIHGFLADCGKLDRLITIGDVASGRWRPKVDDLLAKLTSPSVSST